MLDASPPIAVKGRDRQEIRDALELGLHAFPDEDAQRLRDVFGETVAWTTWERIADSLGRSLASATNPDPSVLAGLARIASTAVNAIRGRH